MRFDKVGYLGEKRYEMDEIHQQVEKISWRKVYYNRYRQSASLQTAAGQNEFKKTIQLSVRTCDYNNEKLFRTEEGARYTVVDPADQGEYTVLMCQEYTENRGDTD